jgi:hypothetical protein
MTTYVFTGTVRETFPAFGLTADPGGVYELPTGIVHVRLVAQPTQPDPAPDAEGTTTTPEEPGQ